MKKKILSLVFGFSLIFMAASMYACTNLLVTKGASADGACMISYTADSHVLFGELYFRAAADYPDGTMFQIREWDTGKKLGKINQVRHTYSVIGNMNEHQLAIGETTFGGREELVDTTAIIDYGSLIYLTLQRAKTAREAIKIMGDLVAEYGYYSEGESFSICDANEAWILEMVGKGPGNRGALWVAMRIPDGYISGHANQARITTFPLNDPENCIYAKDVISFARKEGWFKGEDKDFSFSDTYHPVTFGGARFCEARVWSAFNRVNKDMGKYLDYAMGKDLKNRMPLWIKPDQKISVHGLMELMRDHYENTPMSMSEDVGAGPYHCPYRWRPMTWQLDGIDYIHERAISTQQTGFSFVTQCRSWLPDPIGGIFWFGVDDSYSTVYSPMYCGITKVPESFAQGNGSMMEFNENAAFWVFNQVSNFAYTRYNDMIPEIRAVQAELEKKYLDNTATIDAKAGELYKSSPKKAIAYLTEYSVTQGNATVKRWKELYAYLFTKYMDGNIKTKVEGQMNPKVQQPPMSADWYWLIVRETRNRYRALGKD
ncbi:MAG: C69 family dipeptidase [Bacteroidota bacterium]